MTHINKGVCQWRATNGKPPYFVHYHDENGQNQYEYFATISAMYKRYDALKKAEVKKHGYETVG